MHEVSRCHFKKYVFHRCLTVDP